MNTSVTASQNEGDSMDNTWENEFFKGLTILSGLCGYELTEDLVEFYDRYLHKFSYEERNKAVWEIIGERGSRDPFPSPKQIKVIIEPELSSADLSTDIASKITAAISRRGYTWADVFHYDGHEDFKAAQIAEFGEMGYLIVQRLGGWPALASNTAPVTILRSQIQKLTESLLKQDKLGMLESEKAKALGSRSSQLQQLIETSTKALNEGEQRD